jgi:hypothetical protein
LYRCQDTKEEHDISERVWRKGTEKRKLRRALGRKLTSVLGTEGREWKGYDEKGNGRGEEDEN